MSKLAILGGPQSGTVKIPSWPIFDQREIDAVSDVVRSGSWGIGGQKVPEFERSFAAYCRATHGITSVNGTVTLRLALEALEVGPGDEVILPGITFQATAAVVLDVNAVPIIVDVDPDTYTIDPEKIEEAITDRTKCIIPVHLYGRIANMDAVMEVARKHDLRVLEDCAHQHGSEWDGKHVGTIGDIGSFSLQAFKVLNSGEGGVLVTNDETLNERLCSLRNIGLPVREGAAHMQSGNYRMTEFQAAILLGQMSRLDEQVDRRDENVRYMESQIDGIAGITPLFRHQKTTRQSYFRWVLKYEQEAWENVPRDTFLKALHAELGDSIRFSSTYAPLHRSALYSPHSKKTHRLSQEYWEAIDPKRFHLPVCNKAYEEEAITLLHMVLLADRGSCATIVNALSKLRENCEELQLVERA